MHGCAPGLAELDDLSDDDLLRLAYAPGVLDARTPLELELLVRLEVAAEQIAHVEGAASASRRLPLSCRAFAILVVASLSVAPIASQRPDSRCASAVPIPYRAGEPPTRGRRRGSTAGDGLCSSAGG